MLSASLNKIFPFLSTNISLLMVIYASLVTLFIMGNGRKEGNVLFNDALNTFYFTVIWRRTYGKVPLR